MKFYCISLLLLLFVLRTNAQTGINLQTSEINSFDFEKKIEDKNGKLITNNTEKTNYYKNKQKQLDFYNKKVHHTIALSPVFLCANGSFEEFETISGTNFLKNFSYAQGGLLNPIQCKNLDATENIGIPQFDPNNLDNMSTTVPSNFLDEYIGNINAFDQFALKINYKESYETAALVQAKRFKTNNENYVKFNYKAVLQSITDYNHNNEQPFFKARIINNNGLVVSEFCLIGDPQNCIFTQSPILEEESVVLYTPNWQSGVLDISAIPNNEPFTIEFLASRCGLDAHFGYAYIDDICQVHSLENFQGSIELDPLYEICPSLPISVCGSFTIPTSGGISATISSIILTVKDASNTIVYTTPVTSSLNLITKRFCFTIASTNLPNITTSNYNVGVTINYGISQSDCTGTNFASSTDDDANPGWDIWFLNCTDCLLNVQTAKLSLCDTNKDGREFFNLSNLDPLIISPIANLTFTYFTNLNDATNNINPIANFLNYESFSTTLFVRITQSTTCYKIIPIELIVINPNTTISGILNLCHGSTILNASEGTNYLWNTGATSQSITVSSIGTYFVTVTDNNGCSSIGSVTIFASQIAPQPTIQVTQPNCITITGSISITSPAALYSFDNGVTWGTSPTAENLPLGNYQILIISDEGCISYATSINIVPFQSSFPNFSQLNPTFCGGTGSITITTVAAFYSFDDGITWTTNNIATNLPFGTYHIKTKDTTGCMSNYNSVTIFGDFLDLPLFTKNNPYCGNLGSITINTPAAEYSFDGGITWQTSNTLSNITIGSYILQIKDSQGCTSPTIYVYLKNLENSFPEYTIDEAGCGKFATITITTPGDLYSFDNGTSWTTNNYLSNLVGGASYNLKVKKNPNCTSLTKIVYLNNIFLPNPTPNNYTTTVCDNLNDNTEVVNLNNYSNYLIPNSTNYTFEFYNSLIGAENQLVINQIINSTNYIISNSNNLIFVRVISANGCYKVVELKINQIYSPTIHMENSYPLCVDKYAIIHAENGYASYLWSTGETLSHITVTQSGNYWVTVTENHTQGLVCSSTKNFNVFLSNFATITNIVTFDWSDNDNVIIANVTGIGEWEYSLDGINYQDSNTFNNLTFGTYTIYIRDKNGCGIVSKQVFLLNYPKFFTPNNDGFNDFWRIKFSQVEPNLTVSILDRFGKLITTLKSNSPGWDGTYNGKQMPSDDYWFVVKRENGQEHRAHFALKR